MNATTKEQQTALSLPERAAVALGAAEHEIKLRELVKSSADIVAVIDPSGREQAHRIGMTLKTARVTIEKTGKAAREDATAFSKAVIAEEKRLVGLIVPEEERVLSLRDQFDAAEQARKDALILAERQRTDAIQAAIQAIREIPISMAGKSSQDISSCIAGLVGTIPDEFYQEFIEQARAARHESLDKLAAMETAQRGIEIEAESQRQEVARQALAAEDARKVAAQQAADEAAAVAKQKAENERIANEHAATAKRLADQEAAQALAAKQLADKAAANLKADRDAQELAMKLEREKAAAEQAKAAAEIKAAQDKLYADEVAYATKVQRDITDHAEALEINAVFDAAIARAAVEPEKFAQADDLARCNATVDHLLTDARQADSVAAYMDAGLDTEFDETPTDKEIIENYCDHFGGTPEQAFMRISKMVMDAIDPTGDMMRAKLAA